MTADTLPKLLVRNAHSFGERVALRNKSKGIWRSYTWQDYLETVKSFSLGLVALGLQPGQKVVIIGDNDPEWYFSELAVQSAGAASAGIFPDATAAEMAYVIDNCDATMAIVRDQEQVDKLLSVRDELPLLGKLIYWYPKGMWQYSDPQLFSFPQAQQIGRDYQRDHPDAFDKRVEAGQAGDMAIICYTSGTSGQPKGAILTHHDLTSMVEIYLESRLMPLVSTDVWLSHTSPAWSTDQYCGITSSLMAGITVGFAEKPETVPQDLRELAPTYFFAGPVYWEHIASETLARISDASPLHRMCYRLALSVGHKIADLRFANRPINVFWRALYALAYLAVFRQLKDRFGLSRIRLAYVGGAPAGRDILRFFQAWGVNLRRVYGTSETGMISIQREDRVSDETVGVVLPGRGLRISSEGEIQVKTDFAGYYKNDAATAEKLCDGWFRTGDGGYVTERGELVFLDRVDDLADLGNGARFAPQYVEAMLRFSPYVAEAVAIGGQQFEYVTLLVVVDYENTSKWAEKRGVVFSTYADLSQKPAVQKLVLGEVERVNKFLPPEGRVQKFVVLHKELDPDDQELTRTRKVRRRLLEARYRLLLEGMYGGKSEVLVESEVIYADGKKGKTAAKVGVVTVPEVKR